MRKVLLIFLFLLSLSHLMAQTEPDLSPEEKAKREKNIQAGNPFKRFGYTPKIATLSKGKYLEFHDLDSVVRIGSFSYHVKNREIVGYTAYDTLYPESTLRPELMSRWISPDPLSEEFPSWSPYVYTNNNPIRFIDPTGMATEDCCPDLVKGLKGVYGSVKSEVVGTYNFVTSDAYKSETWKGMGNLIVGVAAVGQSGNILNAYEADALLGTNSVGAVQGLQTSMESFGKNLTSGDIEKTAGAITTAALFFAPTKLDDLSKISKLSKVDNVLLETLSSKGNLTSKTTLSGHEALEAGIKHIGSDYSEIGKKGSGVYRSNVMNNDGTYNQFRMDNNSLKGDHPPKVQHIHLEVINLKTNKPIINNHIPFKD